MINIAAGGDFLYEIFSYLNLDLIKDNIKWFGGSSDPTSLIYTITTNLDIATIYTPCNMSGYSNDSLHQSYLDYFEIIKGNLVKQYKSSKYESEDDVFDLDNDWNSYGEDVDESGVLIGGCIECLKDLIGTKYDKTLEFIEKYKDEGIIWYFDVFSLSVEDLYRTLLQFKYAGWFKYTKLIVIGKVKYPNTFTDLTYEDMIRKALNDYKVIYKFDVGHVKPSMTMLNGMKARIVYNDKEGSLEYLK
jgi:muramoyltetrapeptide carboxypeptidase LdcA involved in peptidoglycan recycling